MISKHPPLECKYLNNYKRNKGIDIIKGIAMCLVIWGHCLEYASNGHYDFFSLPVFRFIYSFHMPLFAIVSGYLLGLSLYCRTLQENIQHKIITIFWPIITSHLLWFILVSIPHFIISILGKNTSSIENFAKVIFAGHSMSKFWFLWAILSCSIVSCILFQNTKNIYKKIFMAIFLPFVTLQFPCGNLIFNMYPFFIVGTVFGINHQLCYKFSSFPKWIKVIVLFLFIGLCPLYKEQCFIYRPIYLIEISLIQNLYLYAIRLGCGFLGILTIIIFLENVRKFCIIIKNTVVNSFIIKIANLFSFIGGKLIKVLCVSKHYF